MSSHTRTGQKTGEFFAGDLTIKQDQRYFGWQVAFLVFGRTERWWRQNRVRLIRNEGFPRPISNTFNAPWYGEDLIAWMRRDKTPAAKNTPHSIVDITARLKERALKVAER
jgi:hypothetical protein